MSDGFASPEIRAESPSWVSRVLRIEWLGQTAASLFWITSMFSYGISSAGDYLQVSAASAWLIANIASAASSRKK
ncbi:MAG: hypothetical protein AAGB48_05140 [Planctomycetota bacterium]